MISPRLAYIGSLVPEGARIADVGTDHGYLPVFLAKTGKIAGGVATDLREKPLAKAAAHLAEAGVTSVRTVLCDGLAAVSPDEVDTVIIAGMGGDVITHILENAPWLRDDAKRLILQPMSHADTLRRSLAATGFSVLSERAVRDAGRLYAVSVARYTGNCRELTEFEALTGGLAVSPGAEERALLARLRGAVAQKADRLRGRPRYAETYRETVALLAQFDAVSE